MVIEVIAKEMKKFCDVDLKDRMDHYWSLLIKLVKLLCSLSHGHSGSERDFADIKRTGHL